MLRFVPRYDQNYNNKSNNKINSQTRTTLNNISPLLSKNKRVISFFPFNSLYKSFSTFLLRLSVWEGPNGDCAQTGWKGRDGLHCWLWTKRDALQRLVHGDITHHIRTISTSGVRDPSLPGNSTPLRARVRVVCSVYILRVTRSKNLHWRDTEQKVAAAGNKGRV